MYSANTFTSLYAFKSIGPFFSTSLLSVISSSPEFIVTNIRGAPRRSANHAATGESKPPLTVATKGSSNPKGKPPGALILSPEIYANF